MPCPTHPNLKGWKKNCAGCQRNLARRQSKMGGSALASLKPKGVKKIKKSNPQEAVMAGVDFEKILNGDDQIAKSGKKKGKGAKGTRSMGQEMNPHRGSSSTAPVPKKPSPGKVERKPAGNTPVTTTKKSERPLFPINKSFSLTRVQGRDGDEAVAKSITEHGSAGYATSARNGALEKESAEFKKAMAKKDDDGDSDDGDADDEDSDDTSSDDDSSDEESDTDDE